MLEPLTDRQQQMLDFVRDHLRRHGRPPTLQEIAAALDFHSANAVTCHLEALVRKGWIEKDVHTGRGIRLTAAALQAGRDSGNRLAQKVREQEAELLALRRRLEEAEKTRQSLEDRLRRAEGLAAAVRQAVVRLETFLALEAQRQPAKAAGLEVALGILRGHLGPVLGDEAARVAAAVLEVAPLHAERCRSAGRPGECRLCDAVAAYCKLHAPG
jgi:DNA-binding MarR family transcriptional regulator